MADEPEPVVRCGSCKAIVAEPPGLPPEKRRPCPSCGAVSRHFEVTLLGTVVATGDVIVEATPATLRLEADPPQVVIQERELVLEDAGYDVQWVRLSEGGAWLVRVFDRSGDFIDGAMADDPQDAILAVSEKLLPS